MTDPKLPQTDKERIEALEKRVRELETCVSGLQTWVQAVHDAAHDAGLYVGSEREPVIGEG